MDRNALKALIREKGFTYQTLGEEIGISMQGVEAIVSGRSQGATARYSLAKALGVEVEDIWPVREPGETAA